MHQLKRIAEILELDLNDLFEIQLPDDAAQESAVAADLRFAQEIKNLYKKFYS